MNNKTLYKIGYGLYIIGARKGDKLNGQIANTVFQITSEPATLAVSINKQNLTHEFIQASNAFSVSILGQDAPIDFIGKFGFKSGRDMDKLKGVNHQFGSTQAPIITDYAVAYFECKVIKQLDVGTHTVFIGEVVAAEIIKEAEPMTYDYYHKVKRGTAPKTAPTYIKEDVVVKSPKEKTGGNVMEQYVCTICGYVYDPAKGEPDAKIPPGTAFKDLPESYICPICGAGKDKFQKQ
jgi:flavin reductase (DIM6/NTAB) family NADH-FMN oxidoreductase RutF/rubredoxin